MKKIIPIFGAMIFTFASLISCNEDNGNNNAEKVALKEKKDSIIIEQTKVIIEDKIEPGIIKKVNITYSSKSIENEDMGNTTESVKNGGVLLLNGCNTDEIKKIKIEGSGNKLTLTISSNGKVFFEKKDISIDDFISLTEKDGIGFGDITITQQNKTLFKNKLSISGCN